MSLVRSVKTRFGRPVLLNVRPLRDRRSDEPGFCSVCGSNTVFRFNSWVISDEMRRNWADPAVSLAYTRRESLFCRSCCASLRVRGIGDALLWLYGPGTACIDDLTRQEDFRRLEVAEINAIGSTGSLHSYLARLPRLAYSEYRGSDGLGQIVEGARNEDICRLTYPDRAFDLVLTSETLEHVPDFRAALRETLRVLKPGGRHVFTIPVVSTHATTTTRTRIDDEGHVVHLMPPLRHGRGAGLYRHLPVGEDMLVFTDFGADVMDLLREVGFQPEVLSTNDGDETGASLVFVGTLPT